MKTRSHKLLADVAMSLKGHINDHSGRWWSGWKRRHWPADALRRGFRFYAYDKESRSLFALVEVTRGSSFTYRTLAEFERKVKQVAGYWPGRDDPYFGTLPLPASGKVSTGCAFRWKRVKTVSIPWRGRFPQLGWAHLPAEGKYAADVNSIASDDEGGRTMRSHLAVERKPWLRALAKDFWRNKLGRLRCLVCGFDFEQRYGVLGAEFIEMHHIKPLASRQGRRRTKVKDLTPLCSNCHRMVHYKRRIPLTLQALKQKVAANRRIHADARKSSARG